VNLVANSVESRSLLLQDRQAQLRGAEDARRALMRLAAIHNLLEELEQLLQSGVRRTVMDRIVALFTELSFNVSRSQQSRFVVELKPRLLAAEQSMERALKEQFLEALSNGDRAAMAHAMRAYTAMSRESVPRALFRNVVMGPLIAEIVTLKVV
jgi:hypothetical protein